MHSVQIQFGELRGFITERDFEQAEQEFPGITRFYYSSCTRPPTFLDLLVAFTSSNPSGHHPRCSRSRARRSTMPTDKDSHPTFAPDAPEPYENSTDATRGEGLVIRVKKRKVELEAALDKLPDDELTARGDLAIALAVVDGILTSDLDPLPHVTAVDLSRWLETNKHLAEVVPDPT